MNILILGIGNVLFGDEGVGVHLANLLKTNYDFSGEHSVSIVDGGTLAQRLIPIITAYDYVILIDCVDADKASIGDVFFFDFENVPHSITWQGSAHEVEMLQTLQMLDMFGDRPPVKIVGVVPFVIGENTTFELSKPVLDATKTMEHTILSHLKELGVNVTQKDSKEINELTELFFRDRY